MQINNRKNKYGINLNTMETSTASQTDCTGAVVRPPKTESELESYLETIPYLPKCPDESEVPPSAK